MARHAHKLILSLVGLCLLASVGGGAYYRAQRRALLREAENDLRAIANMKSRQIEQWRQDWLSVGYLVMDSVFLRQSIQGWMASGTAAVGEEMQRRLGHLSLRSGLAQSMVVDVSGRVLISSSGPITEIREPVRIALRQAFDERRPAFTQLHEGGQGIHLSMVVPLFADEAQTVPQAAVVMVCDAAAFLYPLMQEWPLPSRTAEVLIVRREGDRVLFLNELRWRKGTALKLSHPLTEATLPAVRAVLGEEGVVSGIDYRGEPVLAALKHVPSSDWFMVAKVDRAEALAVWREEAGMIVVAVIGLVLAMGTATLAFWQRRDVAYHRSLAEAERELAASRQEVETYFEESLVGMAISCPGDMWRRVNRALCTMLGYTAEELHRLSWSGVTHPDDRSTGEAHLRATLAGEIDSWEREMRFLRKDGTEVPVIQTVHAVRCPDGTVDYMLSQYQDITSRKRQEESLRESEEVGRAIFEQATVGIAHVSPDGQWQRANERLCRTLGFAADELVGRQFLEAIAEAGRPEAAERMQDMLAGEGESHMAEVMCLRRDGGSWWCVLGVRLVRTVHGEPRFFVVVLEDVDARKRAEQELELLNRELQRSNEELQQFAYVASHDLQEPLRMVSSYTQLLQESYGEQLGENGHKWIHYAVDGARRMQTLIQDLLSYSRVATRHHAFEVVDSHAALGRALGNLRPVIDESQALVSNGDLPDVPADPGQLTQVFQNLIGNSIKYRREGHPPHIHVSAIRQGAFWEFSVADNGIGIDARFRDRVFVIFQRLHTRQEYPGTGIGLAICRRIVERHGGEIWFESELGKGTTFRFTLAAAPEGTEST